VLNEKKEKTNEAKIKRRKRNKEIKKERAE
jgi:hypothetical protein